MAGTISISLQQRVDITNGRLLAGGKLYFYAAGTTTPQLAYKDTALTLPHPNPITLASDGQIPQLYFADGTIRARLLNKSGIVQFDEANILVNGPSTGGGGGGATDPNAIFQTGDVMWLDVAGGRAGWVRDNGRTIGAASSGASERANVDCQALFLFLWQTYSDTFCPVVTGRGATALADWGANKQITLPDKRGYVPGGLTDMGNADSARFTGVPFAQGNSITPGSLCGEARHTQAAGEMPAHSHVATVIDPGHSHTMTTSLWKDGVSAGINLSDVVITANAAGNPVTVAGAVTGITVGNSSTGGGTAMTVTQLTALGTFYRRL